MLAAWPVKWRSPAWIRTVSALASAVLLLVVAALLAASAQGPDGRAAAGAYWFQGSDDGFPMRSSEGAARKNLSTLPFGSKDPLQATYVTLAPAPPREGLALLLPAAEGEIRLFINGVEAPAAPSSAARYLSMPGASARLWDIPAILVHPGLNRIDLLLARTTGRSLRAPPVMGSASRLRRAFGRITATVGPASGTVMLLALTAAGLALAAALARRSALPWIALSAAAAATGARAALGEPGMMAGLAGGRPAADVALLFMVLICLACAIVGTRSPSSPAGRSGSRWRHPAGEGLVIGLAGPAITAGLAGAAESPWGVWPLGLEAVHDLGAVLLLLALVAVAVRVSVPAGARLVVQGLDMGRTIRRQRAEIAAASMALQQEMRRTTILEERQRLARDMHDGIGGQLVSLLARVRARLISPEQMEDELSGGLSELRLLVDSLDAVGTSLAEATASFRARVRPQVEAAGMTLTWRQPDGLEIETDDPRWILNLYRLLQEAVTNAVRHSGGEGLTISIERRAERDLLFSVEDDGHGFDPRSVSQGKGLSNMAFRAGQLGAELRWETPASGTGAAVRIAVAVPETARAGRPSGQSSGEITPN